MHSAHDDQFFEQLADNVPLAAEATQAPSRLKSRIYSTLMLHAAERGSLASVTQARSSGYGLCVFEELVRIAPVGETVKCLNFCRVCHARVMAEHMENPPIYWPDCPYVKFQSQKP